MATALYSSNRFWPASPQEPFAEPSLSASIGPVEFSDHVHGNVQGTIDDPSRKSGARSPTTAGRFRAGVRVQVGAGDAAGTHSGRRRGSLLEPMTTLTAGENAANRQIYAFSQPRLHLKRRKARMGLSQRGTSWISHTWVRPDCSGGKTLAPRIAFIFNSTCSLD